MDRDAALNGRPDGEDSTGRRGSSKQPNLIISTFKVNLVDSSRLPVGFGDRQGLLGAHRSRGPDHATMKLLNADPQGSGERPDIRKGVRPVVERLYERCVEWMDRAEESCSGCWERSAQEEGRIEAGLNSGARPRQIQQIAVGTSAGFPPLHGATVFSPTS